MNVDVATLAAHLEAALTEYPTAKPGFLIGEVMRRTHRQADPQLLQHLIRGRLDHTDQPPPVTRERTFPQEVAAFILTEAKRDYNRLGVFPVPAEVVGALIHAKRSGDITQDEMLTLYGAMAGRPA